MALLHLTPRDGVLVLELVNPPANALSRSLLRELSSALEDIRRSLPAALVVTGGAGKFFSAGLDLLELPELDCAAVEALADELTSVMLRIFRLPLPVVAAVNGHAVAGGAILALAAEHRIAAHGGALIGLNEVQVGLPLPAPLFEIVRSRIGAKHASQVLLEGRNHPVGEALEIGLVHEAVEPLELESHAMALAQRLSRVPKGAYARMKELLCAEAEERIAGTPKDEAFVRVWFEPETRKAMQAAVESLQKGKMEKLRKGKNGG